MNEKNEAAEAVLLVLVRDGEALTLHRPHEAEGALPSDEVRDAESPVEAGTRVAREQLAVDSTPKHLGTFRMGYDGRAGGAHVALLVSPLIDDPDPTSYGVTAAWEPVGTSPEKTGVSAQITNSEALTALREELESRPYAYTGPRPMTSARRTRLTILGACLVAAAVMGGIELGVWWDGFRLSVIDPRLAYEYGYIGELTDRDYPRRPRGVSGFNHLPLFFLGWFGTPLLGVAFARCTRLARGPGHLALTAALVTAGGAVGFHWHSRDWTEPTQGGPDGHPIIYHGGTWLTLIAITVCAISLLLWLAARREARNRESAPGLRAL